MAVLSKKIDTGVCILGFIQIKLHAKVMIIYLRGLCGSLTRCSPFLKLFNTDYVLQCKYAIVGT